MKTGFLTILIFMLSSGTFAASAGSGQKPASWYWQKGLDAARNGATDSALSLMRQSFGRGIPDDSLYYLWAEVYLYKGSLDTALALNFSVKTFPGRGLRTKALKQRYGIYSALGWQREADAVRDSLAREPGMLLRRLLPECNLFLSGGVYRENITVNRNYPFEPREYDSTATFTEGNGDASLRLGWTVPIGRTQGLQFGARLLYFGSRFSTTSLKERFNDSTDISAGGYLRYTLFSNRLAVSYTGSRRKDFIHNTTFMHQFALRYGFPAAQWIGSLEAGYSYRFPLQRHYYSIRTNFDRPMDSKNDIGYTLQFSGMRTEPLKIEENIPILFVKDGVIYRNSNFESPISNIKELTNATPYMATSIARSYSSINPNLRHEYRINKVFSTGLNGGYTCTWYHGKYEWFVLTYPYSEIPQIEGAQEIVNSTTIMTYDGNDHRYYWAEGIGITNKIKTETIHPISFHSEQRVDQALTLNLFFKCSLGRFGDIMLDILMERYFSTLARSAPVDIQKWYGELMLTWFFRFKPDYGP